MADTPSIRVVKEFTYRDSNKRFSNRYHFTGGTPSTAENWHSFMDAVVNLEKTLWDGSVDIVECIGYAASSDAPAATKTYTQAGTGSFAGEHVPGDCTITARQSTPKVSTKGHPVYVFSYFHGAVRHNTDTTGDVLDTAQKTAATTYLNGWKDGITAGGITATRSTPDGVEVDGTLVEAYIGHRDFPG